MAKRKVKKKFGVKVSTKEINETINNWIEEIKSKVAQGKRVNMDKNSYIQVIGTPILNNVAAVKMISNGLYMTRTGFIKKADNLNSTRKDYIYGIEFVTKLAKDKKLYFTASKSFSKQVNEALTNTNTYFQLNVN